MQLSKPMDQKRRLIILGASLILVVLIVMALLGVFGGSNRKMSATLLRCVSTQDVTPFGDNILYYDGMTLYCLNSRGGEKWSYTLGENARFSCSDSVIAAWSGTQLHIINRDGFSTYNENLPDVIQFARVGSKYVAVVLGQDISPALYIKDMQGTTVDKLPTAYEDMILLDLGFFGDGEYLWATSLDVFGTVPNYTMQTFRVNMTSSGKISLGENLCYAIVYADNKLNVISTRQLSQYDYRGTLDPDSTVLVYGWQLIDDHVYGNQAMLLFAPTRETALTAGLQQLRLISGKNDKRLSLPSECVSAGLYNHKIYAFSADTVYRADMSARRFTAISLPAELNGATVTGYLGMLNNGVALLACDSDVYAVVLP